MQLRRTLFLSLLCCITAFESQGVAPHVAGVGLGNTQQGVRAMLGAPDRQDESLGMRFWNYQRRGVTVIWREGNTGVNGIVVYRAEAGDIGGVTVGDTESALRRTWGVPARVRQEGRFLDYVSAGWVLSAELSRGRVVEITLMRPSAVPR